ncbi:hypothetical protein H6G89_01775 [Oscillatoria sp. FACHB-1407]|uniref:hypothetical protein n=1 Tax=Oscillatoria sp. FACHB-1407 TaxID=2692847 RepID=UPI0016838E64|nr:hypothetical protein [Oscillatoria sp. FACHB-1407]MBD2459761.1 hypothetical protein [Oscillatoria sp. FACHB-1407]
MCGKTLAHNLDALDEVANRLNLQSLTQMISTSEEDLDDLLDEPIEEPLEEAWFSPQVGLATVNALSGFVKEHPDQFDQTPQLLEDLAGVKHYLELAGQRLVSTAIPDVVLGKLVTTKVIPISCWIVADHWVGAFRETPLRNHVQRSQFKLM